MITCYTVPHFIDWTKYHDAISKIVNNNLPYQLLIKKTIKLSILPRPELTLYNVELTSKELNQVIIADAIKIYPSLYGLSQQKFIINDVSLYNATLLIHKKSDDTIIRIPDPLINLRQINLYNTTVSVYNIDNDMLITKLDALNLAINLRPTAATLEVKGNLPLNKEVVNLYAQVKQNSEQEYNHLVKINANSFAFIANSKMKQGKLSGNVSVDINNLSQFTSSHFPNLSFLRTSENLNIAGELSGDINNLIIENATVSSKNINGHGQVKANLKQSKLVDLGLVLDKINLDQLLSTPATQNKNAHILSTEEMAEKEAISKLVENKTEATHLLSDLLFGFDILYDFKITELIYNNQAVSNIIFSAEMHNGMTDLYEFSFKLPGDTNIELAGTVMQNQYRPELRGKIVAGGNNLNAVLEWLKISKDGTFGTYKYRSDISVTPREVRLNNISLNIEKAQILGGINYKYKDSPKKVNASLEVAQLDLNKSDLSIHPLDLTNNDFIQNLRRFDHECDIDLMLKSFGFNKQTYDRLLIESHIIPGSISIDKIIAESPKNNFEGKLSVDVRAIKPKLSITLQGDKIEQALLHLVEYNKTKQQTQPTAASIWSPEEFTLFPLDKFDGDFNIKFKTLAGNNRSFSDFKFQAKMRDGVVNIESIEAGLFGGKFNASGSMTTSDLSLNLSFGLANIILEDFLKEFGINHIAGYGSLSGSLTTYGNNILALVSHLNGKYVLAGRRITVNNLNLEQFPDAMTNNKSLQKDDLWQIKANASTQGTTIIESADGELSAHDGVIEYPKLIFSTKRTSGAINTRLDLVNSIVTMAGKFAFIPHENTQPVSVGITVNGPINKPTIDFDTNSLEHYISTVRY
jgi:hypothetical protein